MLSETDKYYLIHLIISDLSFENACVALGEYAQVISPFSIFPPAERERLCSPGELLPSEGDNKQDLLAGEQTGS